MKSHECIYINVYLIYQERCFSITSLWEDWEQDFPKISEAALAMWEDVSFSGLQDGTPMVVPLHRWMVYNGKSINEW